VISTGDRCTGGDSCAVINQLHNVVRINSACVQSRGRHGGCVGLHDRAALHGRCSHRCSRCVRQHHSSRLKAMSELHTRRETVELWEKPTI
jgi:hypothetical protein